MSRAKPSPKRYAVPPWAASELDFRKEVEDLYAEEEPDVALALRCWDGETICVPVEVDHARVAAGLCALSNACDEIADSKKRGDPAKKYNRWASLGLSGLAMRVAKGGA